DTIPLNISENSTSIIEHEAKVSKISEDELFYLMSRGLSEEQATEMIVMGFLEPFTRELPMEYAVELNQLLKIDMSDSIG
ncbi:MAG: SufD family Fe-S cluster assembly protein, partial [Solobacterium sp.]|nr:SufD family Fe-S cluster assembly protein [Solobacterium sp.]